MRTRAVERDLSLADERIAVVGVGLMGHGIAQVFAECGAVVTVHDPEPKALASVRDRIERNLHLLGRDEGAARLIRPQSDVAVAVADATIVFEAAPEDLELKRDTFRQLSELAPPSAILATNTSVLRVGEIGGLARDPERVVGTHWWNPPYLLALVEVIQAPATDEATVSTVTKLLAAAGKTPVWVRRDVPGFIGNRLQHALMRQAFELLDAGVCDATTIDLVVRHGFGRRLAALGPTELPTWSDWT